MKYLIPILLLIIVMAFTVNHKGTANIKQVYRDTVPSGVPQLFGGKYYKFNGYILADSFIMNAAGDTNNRPYFPSLKFKASDNKWYGWDRSRWRAFQYETNPVSANNGLSEIGSAIQWGQAISAGGNPAALTHNTEIPLNGFNTVFTGTGTVGIGLNTPNAFTSLDVLSSGINNAIKATSATGASITGTSTLGNGITGFSNTTGIGVQGQSNGGYGIVGNGGQNGVGGRFTLTQQGNSADNIMLDLNLLPTGSGVTAGAGFTIAMRTPFTNGVSNTITGKLKQYLSNATPGAYSSELEFHLANNTVLARKALLAHNGQWTWDGYPALTAQIDTTTYKPVAIDGSGNVVKMAGWVGGTQNLQQVTQRGNKTSDTVIATAVRTQRILTDTINQSDFEFSVFPDVQGMTSGFPDMLSSMFDWVINHKDSNNIQGLLTLGDLTDHANTTEYTTISNQFNRIDSLGTLPYLPIVGNHDYDGGEVSVPRPATNFNSYFGTSRFAGKAWEGNSFHNKTENHYIKYDVGRMKFLVIGMEFIPTDSALNWASSVIDSFPDRKVIITTHAYITYFGERSTDTSAYGTLTYGLNLADNSGQELWDNMIRKKKNVIMVLNGHFVNTSNENRGYSRRITDVGDSGNIVHQIFVNYQRDGNATYHNPTGSSNVGMGYFLRLRFSPTRGKVYATYYSSYLNQYDTRIDSFNLYLPSVEIQGSSTITGGLYVTKEARFDDTVTVKSVAKYSVLVSGDDNKLIGDNRFIYKNELLTVPDIDLSNSNVGSIPYIGSDKKIRTATTLVWDSTNNRLGVNITGSPNFNADITGSLKADSILGGTTASDSLFISSTTNATKGIVWIGNSKKIREVNGYTGIGTFFQNNRASNPGNAIHVSMDNTSTFESGITIENKSNLSGAFSRLRLINDGGATAQVFFDRSGGSFFPNGALFGCSAAGGTAYYNSGSGNIYFSKSTTISGSNILVTLLTANGNFGIGSGLTTPLDKLHVAGTARITDTLKLPNIQQKNIDTASLKLAVVDANGAMFKSYWPLIKLAHAIFTPTTGSTIDLVNNAYNIINPTGALISITLNLPSSPADNDRVEIKYTQTVTTVTYSNGTVVDGITGPVAGQLVVLVYDSVTNSWY